MKGALIRTGNLENAAAITRELGYTSMVGGATQSCTKGLGKLQTGFDKLLAWPCVASSHPILHFSVTDVL